MPFDFILPDLGEGITEAEIRKWLVKVGDTVQEHQPVVEVETDKAVVEVPTPRSGKVLSLARGEGEMVTVGEILLSIGEEGEEVTDQGRSVQAPFRLGGGRAARGRGQRRSGPGARNPGGQGFGP